MSIRADQNVVRIEKTLGTLLKVTRDGKTREDENNDMDLIIKKNQLHINDNQTMRQLVGKFDVNIPHSYIGKVENGGRKLSVGEFFAHCKALNVNPKTVFDDLYDLVEATA